MWSIIFSIATSLIGKAKQYLIPILIGTTVIALITTLYYRHSYLSIKQEINTLELVQKVKVEYVEKVIEREKVVYKDRINQIKGDTYDNNKTSCENGIRVIRGTGL
jgi:hypothetical protein